MPFILNRRALLRGLGGAIGIGLCPLEAMFDGNGVAYAAGGTAPKRFALMFMGNGGLDRQWVPSAQGLGYALTPCLMPLAPVRQHVRVVTGLDNTATVTGAENHPQHASGVMTGFGYQSLDDNGEGPAGGPSADFVASQHLGATRLSMLQLGACPRANNGTNLQNNVSFDASGNGLPAQLNPRAVFDRLFMGYTPPASGPDPYVVRRQSVLDTVKGNLTRLQAKLGAADRQRLDDHLTGIRALERSLQAAAVPPAASCQKPGAPAVTSDAPTVAAQMIDLLVMAYACDQVRAVSFMVTKVNSMEPMPWIGLTSPWHSYTHPDATGLGVGQYDQTMIKSVGWHLQLYASLLQKLKATPEGAGNLLDNTLVAFASYHGNAGNHTRQDIPLLAAGGPALVTGDVHWRGNGQTTSNFFLACLKAVGAPVSRFGNSTGAVPLT